MQAGTKHIKSISRTLLTIEEPAARTALDSFPFLRLGFRPFYALAALFAMLAIPLWVSAYLGFWRATPHISVYWHMHEMVFGFAVAVVIGFLYTAVRNWTGIWTPRAAHLGLLATLWIAGRLAMLFAPAALAWPVDAAFIPLAAWPLFRVLKKSGNRRNYFLVGLLGVLGTLNLLFHGGVQGCMGIDPMHMAQAAILVIVLIEMAIGARVIPMFTANAVPGVKQFKDEKRDRLSVALTTIAVLSWILAAPAPLVAATSIAAAASQLLRVAGWGGQRTWRNPLLWILHVSWLWIPAGFFMLGLSELHLLTPSAAFHAFALGSMAGLIIGMITRTALGHTGRPLKAGRAESLMYLAIQCGAILRTYAAASPAYGAQAALIGSALCWTLAFGAYLAVYGPYLMQARIDGKDG